MYRGYRIDEIVEVNGKTVGFEIDGQSHFIGKWRYPLARTILKRRQISSIDEIELVSVPYFGNGENLFPIPSCTITVLLHGPHHNSNESIN